MPDHPREVPVLTDGVVTLRAPRDSDADRIVEFANDPASREFVQALPSPYGPDQARQFIDQLCANWQQPALKHTWAIEVDGRWAGSIGLTARATGTAEVGFGAHPDVRGRGVMKRAARLIVDHAFDDLGLQVLLWRAARGNWASRRVAWSVGFTYDATLPATRTAPDGTLSDTWHAHLLATDPRAPQHPWFAPTPLAGNGIRLRAWRADDTPVDDPDPALSRYMMGSAPTPNGFRQWLTVRQERQAEGEGVFWCIADATSDRALGGIQLFRMNSAVHAGSAMVAYWLAPAARGRGVLRAAFDALLPHAFGSPSVGGMGLHRLAANVDADNLASQQALWSAGFRRSGVEQQSLTYADDAPTAQLAFELLGSDDRVAQRAHALTVPVLRTDRLVLREWRDTDRPAGDPAPDPVLAANMGVDLRPTHSGWSTWLARHRSRALNGRSVGWCIADASTDTAIGSIVVRRIDRRLRSGTIGYTLEEPARGHGRAGEALKAVVDYAFSPDGLDLERLDAVTVDTNHASMLTLAAAGFRLWGQDHRSFVALDGTICDGAYFELLRVEVTE